MAVDKDMAACSRMIGRLEADLGIDLIDHSHRPVQLTASGRALLPYAKALVDAHRRLEEAARQCLAMPIVVRMGIPVNISRSSVFDFLKRYERIDSNLRLEMLSDIDHQDLFEGKADVAYLPYRPFAQQLHANGFVLRYYNSKRLGEVDFVIQNGRDITPIEIKSGKDYKKHSALSNVLAVDEWNLKRAIVFCRGNIERDKAVTYLPWYMVPFVVPEEAASGKMPVIDLSALSDAIKA